MEARSLFVEGNRPMTGNAVTVCMAGIKKYFFSLIPVITRLYKVKPRCRRV